MSQNHRSHKNQHQAKNITTAAVTWNEQNTPVSDQFADVYYSNANGMEESRYVFLHNNNLESRWNKTSDTAANSFTIVETGFGTGLNFLATCAAWQQSRLQKAHLHFVSVEKFPLSSEDLERALHLWPELSDFSEALIERYPPLVPGFHRLEFPDLRISLTLILDDVLSALPQMNLQADAWYLDGFAPARNPDMWQEALFSHMARLSKPQATFATFTAAGVVRRGLQHAGFEVKKTDGFGDKRDMLVGKLSEQPPLPERLPVQANPWFLKHRSPMRPPESALVIGAGLAGTNTARVLAERGIQVTVAEEHDHIAAEASGNPAGITFTKLSPFDTPQYRFYQKAYLYAVEKIAERLSGSDLKEGKDYALNGVLRFAFSDKETAEQSKLADSGLWPRSFAEPLDPAQCSNLLGFPSALSGFFLKKGGWLTPADLCRCNLSHDNIKLITNTRVNGMLWQDQQWLVSLVNPDNGDSQNLAVDAIIVANSFGARRLPLLEHLPLRSVRGQITYVPGNRETEQAVKHSLNYDGYITPAKSGFHCVGATFQPNSSDREFYPEDHRKNLASLRNAVPSLFNLLFPDGEPDKPWPLTQGRVAFRCQTPDYLPLIGPAPDKEAFLEDYGDLRGGKVKQHYPKGRFLPNCFLNLAHGSRGITSSLFGAEIIASELLGDPSPIDKETLNAIHPARFLIRDLRRNKI